MISHLKIITLLILLVSITHSGYEHISLIITQENIISDKYTEDYQPLDTIISGKHHTLFHNLFIVIFVIISITESINLLIKLTKRYMNLIPIFYQSNYVETPHFDKMH